MLSVMQHSLCNRRSGCTLLHWLAFVCVRAQCAHHVDVGALQKDGRHQRRDTFSLITAACVNARMCSNIAYYPHEPQLHHHILECVFGNKTQCPSGDRRVQSDVISHEQSYSWHLPGTSPVSSFLPLSNPTTGATPSTDKCGIYIGSRFITSLQPWTSSWTMKGK